MVQFDVLGFTATVTKEKLKVEIPIKNLIDGFKDSPNNFCEATVRRGHRREFAKYIAERLVDGSNPDTGDSPIMEAIEQIFEELFEGAEDFVKIPEDEEH